MGPIAKVGIVTLGLLTAGAGRMQFEQNFTEDLRERQLSPPIVDITNWSRMGQSSLAGTFGGLRSAMAFFTSLSAHSHFENQEWYELEKDYEVITSLDPYNSFYWSSGGGHLAYNAASWARGQRDQPEIERLTIEMEYLEAGDAFLREGLRHLPEDHNLWAEIARIWGHRLKRPDPARSLEAWEQAASLSQNPIYHRRCFFTMAQIPGREQDALNLGMAMLTKEPRHLRIPTFRVVLWALYGNPDLPLGLQKPHLAEIFGTKKNAYRELYSYYFRALDEGFYAGRVESDLRRLIIELRVPFHYNPFLSPRERRIPKDW